MKKMMLNEILPIRLILILIGCTSLMTLNGQDLKKHQWENRIVIVKASDIKSTKQEEQLKEFRNSFDELMDRKILVYKITGNDFVLIDYKNSALTTSGKTSKKLSDTILNKNENFEVILIGLDGGIKLQQTEIVLKEDLFNIIDSMPMRRNESIRTKTKN